jgi:hypothetical protein
MTSQYRALNWQNEITATNVEPVDFVARMLLRLGAKLAISSNYVAKTKYPGRAGLPVWILEWAPCSIFRNTYVHITIDFGCKINTIHKCQNDCWSMTLLKWSANVMLPASTCTTRIKCKVRTIALSIPDTQIGDVKHVVPPMRSARGGLMLDGHIHSFYLHLTTRELDIKTPLANGFKTLPSTLKDSRPRQWRQ